MTSHRPLTSPTASSTRPRAPIPSPTTRPAADAVTAARSGSPYRCQRMARSTRPPSSGIPGNRLNSPSATFITASHNAEATTSAGAPTACRTTAPPPANNARPRLVAGPDAAIRKAARGVFGSPPSRLKPPSIHSVIRCTGRPNRRAVSECANSCASSAPMNSAAPSAAVAQYAAEPCPGTSAGSTTMARLSAIRITITSTDQCAPTGMPSTRPKLIVSFTTPPGRAPVATTSTVLGWGRGRQGGWSPGSRDLRDSRRV